jgi:hypothetical protein
MTLVITEISKFGVVMAADTAETRVVKARSGAHYTRIKFGSPKLFPIPAINGGVLFWGAGEILLGGSGVSRIPTDVWLEDFIVSERCQNLEQFSYTLKRTINVLHGPEAPALGFHVAGVDRTVSGTAAPIFYRIVNRDRHGGHTPEFEIERRDTFPHLEQQPTVLPDGDDGVYVDLQERIAAGSPLLSKRGDPIPRASLRGRAEYQAAWVRLVSDLYQSAGLSRTIGGKVTTLAVGYRDELYFQTS